MSLLEALLIVAVIGIMAAIALPQFHSVADGARNTKLESDVDTINQAIGVYLANGGSLEGMSSPADVLSKLKTVRANSDVYAGIRGAMIDKRLAAKMQTVEESLTSARRAFWNSAENRFEISTESTNSVAEFYINEQLANTNFGEEARVDPMVAYNVDNGWIWEYGDTAPVRPPGPTQVPLGGTGGSGSGGNSTPPPASPPTVGDLAPPTFSVPSGSYPQSAYDISLSITNPNTTVDSWIRYSVDGGITFSYYGGALTVAPDTQVLAFVDANRNYWNPSPTVAANYALLQPQKLDPPVIVTSASAFEWVTAESIQVVLTNPNDPGSSTMEYRIDNGPWSPYSRDFTLEMSDYSSDVLIEARALAISNDYIDSDISSNTVGSGAKIQLAAPSIVPNAPTLIPGTQESIVVTITDPNAEGSQLQYRLEGGGWQNYNGPFVISRSSSPEGAFIDAQAIANSAAYLDSTISEGGVGASPQLDFNVNVTTSDPKSNGGGGGSGSLPPPPPGSLYTVRNGSWNSSSTWAGGRRPGSNIGGRHVVIRNSVSFGGDDLYISSGTLTVQGVLTIPNQNIKMESSRGVLNIDKGLIILGNFEP